MGASERTLGCDSSWEIAYSWNPIVGCMHNCIYCWSRRYAARLAAKGIEPYKSRDFRPTFIPERLRQRIPEGRFIFVSDMGDMWGCYDEETEVLTYNGWKRFSEVTYDDLVACLNPLDDRVIYCKPNRIIKYWYEGKMIRIRSNLIDLLVTPDHNLYVALEATSYGGRGQGVELEDFSLIRAEDCLGKRTRFRIDFPNWEGYEVKGSAGIPIEAFMEFLGYYLAEGNVSMVGDEPRIQVAQKNTSPHYENTLKIMRIVAESRGKNVYAYEDRIEIRGDQELTEYLQKFGHGDEKCIDPKIKNLSKRLLSIMLETYIDSKGLRQSETYKKAYTASKRLADDIQEVALKCGYVAIVDATSRKGEKTVNEKVSAEGCDYYEVIIARGNNEAEVECTGDIKATNDLGIEDKCYIGYEDYRGYVYCVEVPTHIIYVRRNGRPVWCGNSWVPRDWIESVLRVVRSKSKSRFLFLTKNPARYHEFIDQFCENVVLGVTIESNRDYGLSRAPPPRERYEAILSLNWRWKALFIEPILDFDDEFIDWIIGIKPCMVYIGYDNYGNRLPEPSLSKTETLIRALSGKVELRFGTLRKAWYERG